MERKKKPGKNTSFAVIFLVVIVLAILASILVQTLLVVKSSKFGDGPSYSIFLSNGKENEILSFDRDRNEISRLKIKERVGDIYKYAEVPIGSIFFSEDLNFNKSISDIVSDLFFGITSGSNNLNAYDSLQMTIMTKVTSPQNIRQKEIPKGLMEDQRDKEFSSFFSDEKIKAENLTIQVINLTDEQGVGGRIARLISNTGGNVILVSGHDENKKSGIYSNDDSYTVKRLSKILNFPRIEGKASGISDVVVIVGDDYSKLSKY